MASTDVFTVPPSAKSEKQNYWNCWKLQTHNGRQVWHFHLPDEVKQNPGSLEQFLREMSDAFRFDPAKNPNSGDKVYRFQQQAHPGTAFSEAPTEITGDLNPPLKEEAFHALKKGWDFYKTLQAEEGHWPGDYGGPQFLLPGLILASYITETPFPAPHRELMKRYMLNHQNKDGGWGLHIEGPSTMFGTVMQYVALRMLGMNAEQPEIIRAKEWIHLHGGATGIPAWGKFYLAVLGIYPWEGCNSLFPELWLLPRWLSFHPSRYWCHSRMVYVPMAYCYGYRVTGKITPLIEALRKELFVVSHELINWEQARDQVAETDRYAGQSLWLKRLNRFTNFYEQFPIRPLRKKALDFLLEYVNAEDRQTGYIDIGPVNQVINSIVVWHACGKDSPQFKAHADRWQDYLWVAEDGMKMNGYNGSQLWDTVFAMQAMTEAGMEKHCPDTLKRAYHYVDITQIKEEVPQRQRFFRHISKGGWPFSTLDHGWPISDCTAEALNAALQTHHTSLMNPQDTINPGRLFEAVDIILSFQNKDGGWATYENTRSYPWMEYLNPAEIFDKIMIDYSWTECTSACVRALSAFHADFPEYRPKKINRAIRKGVAFVKSRQRPDGSWTGSWGVCFTYGTWFGVEALAATGKGRSRNRKEINRACEFLLSEQNEDGGWGESSESCVKKEYIPHRQSQVVNTSWALLALMAAACPDKKPIEKGIRFLLKRQQENGDWDQEGISGVFNANCMITYTAYRNVFPLWALGRFNSLISSR